MLEYDRFGENRILYIAAMLSMIVSVGFVIFALYCLPYILWGWFYEIPNFVFVIQADLMYYYDVSEGLASWSIFFVLLMIGLIFGLMAYVFGLNIEQRLIKAEYGPDETEAEEQITEDATERELSRVKRLELARQTVKVLFIILVALVLLFVVEWIITGPPPEV